MEIKIVPSRLSGSVAAISSKSYAHRVLIAAALCQNPTEVFLNHFSEDINATLTAISALGCEILTKEDGVTVTPRKPTENPTIFCGESGTTARLMLPVAAALYERGVLTGAGTLQNRPFDALCGTMTHHGCAFSQNRLPIAFSGKITPGQYSIPGSQSSQYISGLMFALPLLEGGSSITLTSPLESSGYVDMTLAVLRKFGIESGYHIPGKQTYISPGKIQVEGDWSNAAYWHCAGVEVSGLNPDSLQKDKIFRTVCENGEIDAAEIPDLVPVLAVYAANKTRPTRIFNTRRLRIKESDRIESVMQMITSLGAKITAGENELTIFGGGMKGGIVDSFFDHRIVMSAAVASCFCQQDVIIRNAQAVNKSYPDFFRHFNLLGGNAHVI